MFNFLRGSKVVRKSKDNSSEVTDTRIQWSRRSSLIVGLSLIHI